MSNEPGSSRLYDQSIPFSYGNSRRETEKIEDEGEKKEGDLKKEQNKEGKKRAKSKTKSKSNTVKKEKEPKSVGAVKKMRFNNFMRLEVRGKLMREITKSKVDEYTKMCPESFFDARNGSIPFVLFCSDKSSRVIFIDGNHRYLALQKMSNEMLMPLKKKEVSIRYAVLNPDDFQKTWGCAKVITESTSKADGNGKLPERVMELCNKSYIYENFNLNGRFNEREKDEYAIEALQMRFSEDQIKELPSKSMWKLMSTYLEQSHIVTKKGANGRSHLLPLWILAMGEKSRALFMSRFYSSDPFPRKGAFHERIGRASIVDDEATAKILGQSLKEVEFKYEINVIANTKTSPFQMKTVKDISEVPEFGFVVTKNKLLDVASIKERKLIVCSYSPSTASIHLAAQFETVRTVTLSADLIGVGSDKGVVSTWNSTSRQAVKDLKISLTPSFCISSLFLFCLCL